MLRRSQVSGKYRFIEDDKAEVLPIPEIDGKLISKHLNVEFTKNEYPTCDPVLSEELEDRSTT